MTDKRTVLILAPASVLWATLRHMLQTLAGVTLLGPPRGEEHLIELLAHKSIDILIFDADPGHMAIDAPLLGLCSAGRLRTVAVATAFTPERLQAFLTQGVHGFLCWQDLSLESLERYLPEGGAVTLSPSAAKVLRLHADPSAANPLPLTERERTVLSDLGCGLTQGQIAASGRLSPRTVRRIVAVLEAKLGASSQFMLGALAAQRGLITTDPAR